MTSDAADLSAALAGDRDALARLYDRHAGVVLSLCRRWSSAADAEDAMQETFVRAFRKLDSVASPDRLGGWLYAIARRVCAERRRAAGRRNHHEAQMAMNVAMAGPARCTDAIELSEELQRLTAALDRLPDRERLAVHLYYLDPDPERAASTVMGLSRSGFHKLLARARDQLAGAMREAQRT